MHIQSVSYTHLDVYKRQGNSISLFVEEHVPIASHITTFLIEIRTAVSYTHLDVYKRQQKKNRKKQINRRLEEKKKVAKNRKNLTKRFRLEC